MRYRTAAHQVGNRWFDAEGHNWSLKRLLQDQYDWDVEVVDWQRVKVLDDHYYVDVDFWNEETGTEWSETVRITW